MKSRYCYNPMTPKKLGRRVTLLDRIRRARAQRRNQPDLYEVGGYYPAVFPRK